MSICFFISDLHGKVARYNKLFSQILIEEPEAVFLGGDLLPSGLFALTSNETIVDDFIQDFLITEFLNLKNKMGGKYPHVFLILGNDDSKINEIDFIDGEKLGIWKYIHHKKIRFEDFDIYGYSYVPPTPFQLKDWEKYDVSRFIDPGCVSPEEGWHSVNVPKYELKYSTIEKDLKTLVGNDKLTSTIFLFHTPPYKTNLDRAALDGKMVDHAPLDVHVGSIAVKRFIKKNQPTITLHGHVHESARLTGTWKDNIGKTHLFTAAHDGTELALVRFNKDHPEKSTRELI
ncbi:metallophosphoesterase [Candidatus Neomarinimicrobiota bacterium]